MTDKTPGMRELESCGLRIDSVSRDGKREIWVKRKSPLSSISFEEGFGCYYAVPSVYGGREIVPGALDSATAHAIWLRLDELNAEVVDK